MATVVRASTFLVGTGKCFLPKLCGVLTGKKHFSVTVATGSPSVFMMKGMDQETMTSELAKYMGNADLLQKSQSSFIPPESFGYELPEDGLAAPEFALVGRSNVGKSTLLGALLGDPALATVSKTPGCTRSINYFGVFPPTGLAGGGGDRWQGGMRSGSRNGGRTKSLVPRLYVVDLPGYGFAKAGKAAINGWQATMRRFLGARPPAVLRRVFVLVDARRGGPSAEDHRTMALLDEAAVPYQVVLTKTDLLKSKKYDIAHATEKVFVEMLEKRHGACMPIIHVVSSKTGEGLDELRGSIVTTAKETNLRI